MTFEKALEAIRVGKRVRRKVWDKKYFKTDGTLRIGVISADNADSKEQLALEAILSGSDVLASDWEIYEPKTWYNSAGPVYNCRCEFNPDPWLLKSNQHTEELAKQVREKIFESYTIEPQKEESTMYTDIEITFKSGDTITYGKDEWDDYSYDGTSVCVKKDGAWVGIYNFDHVFSVELKTE